MSTSAIAIERGSASVYVDLGYTDAAAMQRKATLTALISRGIESRRLSHTEAAELLGIDQGKISRITRGLFRGVSEQKMLALVVKLGHDVRIVVGPVKRNKSPGKIQLEVT